MIDLKQYGYTETDTPDDGLAPGRVIEQRRELYTVITGYGEAQAVLKGSFHHETGERGEYPCVGDFVLVKYNADGVSQIAKLLPRRSKFSRADFSGHAAGYVKTVLEQVVAANFNYVFILTSLNQDFKLSRIIRYLTQARQSGGLPVVILTKADLEPDHEAVAETVRKYAPDTPVHAVSSRTGLGLAELNEYLRPGMTVVFLGMSGVGKSSLINVFMERDVMEVREIRDDDSRGRHTTTHRQLFMLPGPLGPGDPGAMVIDTPGMRELGLFNADEGISAGYAGVEELFVSCRFSDCGHISEPGCAVVAAMEDGSLTREDWERYLAQRRENKFVDDKSGYMRDKRSFQKEIAKYSKRQKKNGKYKA